MKSIATLRNGGLTLREPSTGTASGPIRNAVIPSIGVFPLQQHSGVPAVAVVSVGDRVREGMLIAKATDTVSSPVHSSIPGVVSGFRTVRLPNGERSEAIVVTLEGEFERLGVSDPGTGHGKSAGRSELLGRLLELGVVSLDSNGIPLQVHWKVPRGKRVETLIVSALSDEPYVTVERRLAVERRAAFAEGLAYAASILKPRSIVFAEDADDNEANEVAGSLEEVAGRAGIAFSQVRIGPRYPRGEQRELVRITTGRTIPAGTPITDLAVTVTNVSTLVAVRDALSGGKPLIERYITVAGGALMNPSLLRVRIGTRIRDLIDECGGFRDVPDRVVVGGPLTGSIVYDLDTPVTKNMNAVIALSKRETDGEDRTPCISCGRCLSVCPEGLNPSRIFKEIEHGHYERAAAAGLMECTECGACSFVCPSHIPLLYGLRQGKRRLTEGAK